MNQPAEANADALVQSILWKGCDLKCGLCYYRLDQVTQTRGITLEVNGLHISVKQRKLFSLSAKPLM